MRYSYAEFFRYYILFLPKMRCTTLFVGVFIAYDFRRMFNLPSSRLPPLFSWKDNCFGYKN